MLPFENMVADYVRQTKNHVLYRVTPIFVGDNLLAEGVLMEAWSVEDNGDGVCFNVFCYNVEPGVEFDYATGENWASGTPPVKDENNTNKETEPVEEDMETYVLNTNSKKFHKESCSSAGKISEKNKEVFTGYRSDLIDDGYEPCGACKP
jgi:DNA-entry nuclease